MIDGSSYMKSDVSAEDKRISETSEIYETAVVVFKDAALEEILQAMAAYYKVSVIYKREEAKGLRLFFQWDKSLSLAEALARLNNFQQIEIDFSGNSIIVR